MSTRVFWLPAIVALLGNLEIGSISAAFARGGGGAGIGIPRSPAHASPVFRSGRFGTPRLVAGHSGFHPNGFSHGGFHRDGFGHDNEAFNPGVAGFWPYSWWPTDTTPAQYAPAVPSEPQVIVIADSHYTQPRVVPSSSPGDPPDYGYVAGCHAIPNGYHCDAPRPEASAH
jgi:hypothetical protein